MQEALRPSLSQHVSMTALPLSQLAKPEAGGAALKHGARRADTRGAASSQRVPHVALLGPLGGELHAPGATGFMPGSSFARGEPAAKGCL